LRKARSCLSAGALVLFVCSAAATPPVGPTSRTGHAPEDEPIVPDRVIPLFNRKDLDGWTTWLVDTKRQDPRGVYSVQAGAIRISGDGFGYLSTRAAYRDYRLVVEVKWGTRNFQTRVGFARDSGIFLHGVGPDGNSYDCGWGSRKWNTGPEISNGAYRAALECQVMEGGFGDLILIAGRDADGSRVAPRAQIAVVPRAIEADYAKYQFDPRAERQTLTSAAIAWIHKDPTWRDVPGFRGRHDVESPLGEWTRLECICAGARITIFVNGTQVNEAHGVVPSAGRILLQCEGSEVYFRKVELHPLPIRRREPSGPRSIDVRHPNTAR
jgi:hypothetical protein